MIQQREWRWREAPGIQDVSSRSQKWEVHPSSFSGKELLNHTHFLCFLHVKCKFANRVVYLQNVSSISHCLLCWHTFTSILISHLDYCKSLVFLLLWLPLEHSYTFMHAYSCQSGSFKKQNQGFLGGAVVKNLPVNSGDTGSSPGLGRSHMPRGN